MGTTAKYILKGERSTDLEKSRALAGMKVDTGRRIT